MQPNNADEQNFNPTRHFLPAQRKKLVSEIFSCLYDLSKVTDAQAHEIEKLTGLSRCQILTIGILSGSGPVRVSELARRLRLNPSTMVQIIDQIEGKELITRTRSNKDRRVVEIQLTENGKATELTSRTAINKNLMQKASDGDLMEMLSHLNKLSSLFNIARLNPYIPLNAVGQKRR